MPELAAIARERAALAAVADAIVAASVGKGLRVTVACAASRLAVVDHLAQALHARGRATRCLTTSADLPVAGDPAPDPGGNGSTVVVITSGLATESDRGVLRVNVLVTSAEGAPPTGGSPDVILAYGEPGGPVIGYLAPFLSAGSD
ncbi:hypothetical protein GCE86_03180 [Micromonospora terminaliae]|uniref:Uncharacterized protein n=1 Tax=Micromonospora terminaliae TaxID=1914461 RepID=A0AAJ3DM86_9ACTN|nr:hypothetical protein [Micromonospora terminaliae]NES31682.1 hypothetical protein [Micromonospora terminaliae]QGL46136.1 hypothetical protein GCE86_03180 [Micromonospora terminaliae]